MIRKWSNFIFST